MHSPKVKQLVKTFVSRNNVTPHGWLQLVSVVLEHGTQLQWKSCWREETKAHEHQGRVRGYEAFQKQMLDGRHYPDADTQAKNSEHILSLCHAAALDA